MRLAGVAVSMAALASAMSMFFAVQQAGIEQHEIICEMAKADIEFDTGRPGFEEALASWKKFQIEDGCLGTR